MEIAKKANELDTKLADLAEELREYVKAVQALDKAWRREQSEARGGRRVGILEHPVYSKVAAEVHAALSSVASYASAQQEYRHAPGLRRRAKPLPAIKTLTEGLSKHGENG